MAAPRRLHIAFLVSTSAVVSTQSLAQFNVANAISPRTSPSPGVGGARARSARPYARSSSSNSSLSYSSSSSSSALNAAPRRSDRSNWEDDTQSSVNDPRVTDDVPPWRNHHGQLEFTSGSQATPGRKARPFEDAAPSLPPMARMAAMVEQTVAGRLGGQVDAAETRSPSPPAAAAAVAAAPRGGNAAAAGGGGTGTMLHGIKWPLIRDPPGVSSEFPLLMTRIGVTVLSTLATWYLHLFTDYSSVLASSAMTLLVSTCLDRRLGQAAFCGSFAGMCGGHLAPSLAVATALGALTSLSYEVLIHINNFSLGIGGRLGATAFVATSVLAKFRRVAAAGRRMRRGAWSAGGPSEIALTMVLFHVLGAVSTIFLRECSDDSAAADPVRASAVVGLLGSLFLRDATSVLALYGGSFVGMALPSRLMYGNAPGAPRVGAAQTPVKLFGTFAGAGAIAGLIHAITIHSGWWNGGWGGKAGLCAFAGCWVYRGIGNTFDFLTKKKR